jgi:hypothetical protein
MKWIPKIISLVLLWGAVASVIVFIEPEVIKDILLPGAYLPFIVLLSMTIWYTLSVITKSISLSLMMTMSIMVGLILAMLRLMHAGLALVLLLTLVMESWYTYHRNEKIYPTNEQKNRGTGL